MGEGIYRLHGIQIRNLAITTVNCCLTASIEMYYSYHMKGRRVRVDASVVTRFSHIGKLVDLE